MTAQIFTKWFTKWHHGGYVRVFIQSVKVLKYSIFKLEISVHIVVRFAVVYIQDKIVPPTAPSVHIRTEAPKIAWLPAYLHSLTEFKHSAYNFRLQDILTLVYLFFTLDLDETGFKYFVAYN